MNDSTSPKQSTTITPSAYQARFELARELYQEFNEIYIRVSVKEDSTEKLEDLHKAVSEIDELLFNLKSLAVEANSKGDSKATMQKPPTDPPRPTNAKLPQIELPSFSGDIRDFPSFKELFSALIDENILLSDIERFHYLQTSLKGEASSLIKGLSLTVANYKVAKKLLDDRYMNKRLIAQNYLNAMHALKASSSNRSLRVTLECFLENYNAFKALALTSDQIQEFLWFDLLLHKVDSTTRERFELNLNVDKGPRKSSRWALLANIDSLSCPLCKGNHYLAFCKTFLDKSPSDRFTEVKHLNLCLNCIRGNHPARKCPSSKGCKTCGAKHNSLLHFPSSANKSNSIPAPPPSASTSTQVTSSAPIKALTNTTSGTTILLSTALVDVVDAWGGSQTLRVLLDSGSQANFITEPCLQRLGLQLVPTGTPIHGLAQMQSLTSIGSTSCVIKPNGQAEPQLRIIAVVLNQICGDMPATCISSGSWDHVKNLKLADPTFGTPGRIDMLLGAEIFASLLLDGKLCGGSSSPIAINTLFGWVLMGKAGLEESSLCHSFCVTTGPLDKAIRKFWKLEQIPEKSLASAEDIKAEEIYSASYSRDDSGRFSVPLLLRVDDPRFPNSKEIALRRFFALERRLLRDTSIHKSYLDFMQDYLDSGHMQLVHSSLRDEEKMYFIPHHHIQKPDSLTTKLRVVFDASCKSSNGYSLNDTLFTGPKLQTDIASILLKFRLHSVVFTADIKQMYRQINIIPEDRVYHNILWRFSPSEEVKVYQLNTVTYGVSSAPYLALHTIQKLAELERETFPEASKILATDVYVDDLVTGCSSLAEANSLKLDIILLLQSGGFELRKWASNCKALLADVSDVSTASLSLVQGDSNSAVKILGLHWNPNIDYSTVALSWINSSPHRWKTFVSNRVSAIQEKIPPQSWFHVSTLDNPADPASRGLLPQALLECSLWWAGPLWLRENRDSWPRSSFVADPSHVLDEERKIVLVAKVESNFIDLILKRFSSLRKIQGVVAYCSKFLQKGNRRGTSLSHEELYNALCRIVRFVQRMVFSEEITRLEKGNQCLKPLIRLAPFLDKRGVVRVGGRLYHSQLSSEQKHPMLLPSNHRLTDLIIDQFHRDNLHPGPLALHNLIVQQFWILSARRVIKRRLASCYRCFKVRPSFSYPIMGNLPAARVSQIKPFTHTGVDFAGPISTILSRRRGARTEKSYICIFVCFCTKAVHIEAVSDLSSDAFLAALRRFIARRGRCTDIYSDCGTNFVGANKCLSLLAKDSSESLGIRWHFNPPFSPHFGGLWEAGVKSVKTHMYRVIGNQILTFEELCTLLTQIEAVLNSRPLSAMSSDPNDLSPLTPVHFLTLELLTAPPDENLIEVKLNRLSRWQLLQRCHQDFWKRWHLEYLHTLHQRSKWSNDSPNLAVNDIVLIRSENAPPLQWRVGRIEEVHPGSDSVIRVATVRTRAGLIKRPVVKLCRLPESEYT